MRILFSITYYHPHVSGLTIYVKRLAEALKKKGFKPTVLCMRHEKNLKVEGEVRGIRVIRAKPLLAISKGFLSWDFPVKAWQLVKESDTIIVNLPQFEGVWAALFGKLLHKRVIAIYHSEVILPEGFINSVVQSFLEISNFLTLLLADKVVTYTQDFAKNSRLLKSFRGLKKNKKVLYVYPPVPELKVNLETKAKLAQQIGQTDYVIGVAARLAAEKGIEYLLKAIEQIQWQMSNGKCQMKIAIAGSMDPVGEEDYKRKIMKLVKKYKKHIVFLGSLSQEEMGAFYSLLDVLVLPSVNSTEAFGMVQVEAMYAGVPVVVSDLPGVRQPVQKTGMGIVVPPRDSEALAKAISEILENKEKYLRPKESVRKIFAMDRTISFYQKLFKN